MRRRLVIACDGVTEHFVVNNGDAIVASIQQAAAR